MSKMSYLRFGMSDFVCETADRIMKFPIQNYPVLEPDV